MAQKHHHPLCGGEKAHTWYTCEDQRTTEFSLAQDFPRRPGELVPKLDPVSASYLATIKTIMNDSMSTFLHGFKVNGGGEGEREREKHVIAVPDL